VGKVAIRADNVESRDLTRVPEWQMTALLVLRPRKDAEHTITTAFQGISHVQLLTLILISYSYIYHYNHDLVS
jgi:hypothetical protein